MTWFGFLVSALFLAAIVFLSRRLWHLRKSLKSAERDLRVEKMAGVMSRSALDALSRDPRVSANRILTLLGEFVKADRSRIVEFFEDGRSLDVSGEWISPDSDIRPDPRESFTPGDFPWLVRKLAYREPVLIPDVIDLPADAEKERHYWLRQNIHSVLCFPLIRQGEPSGTFLLESRKIGTSLDASLLELLETAAQVHLAARDIDRRTGTLSRDCRNLERALEAFPHPVIIADASRRTIRRINTAALTIMDKKAAPPWNIPIEAYPDYWPTFQPEGNPYPFDQLPLNQALDRGESVCHAEMVLKKGSESYWVSASSAPIHDENGKIRSAVLVLTDITHLRDPGRELDHRAREFERRTVSLNERFKTAQNELGKLSEILTHKLQPRMRSLKADARNLASIHSDALDPALLEKMDTLAGELERSNRMLDDLLRYYRLGEKPVHFDPVSLDEVFIYVRETLQERFRRTGAQMDLPRNLPEVWGDWPLMTLVFTELVENALKFSRPDEPPRVEISVTVLDQEYAVSVRDHGEGVALEHRARIFELFERTPGALDKPGSGAGLALVKKALDLLKASIHLESETGEGTTFHVRFPKTAPKPGPSSPPLA
jgi:signal transduction histidine kinase